MKILLNTVRWDLKRTILSKRFLFAVLGLSLVTIVTMFDEISSFQRGITSIAYIRVIIGYLDFYIIYLLFAAIPGTTLFCADWDNRFIRFSVVRCSKSKYAASKVIACFFSAIGVVFMSEWMTIFTLRRWFPFFEPSYEIEYGLYSLFAERDKIFGYFMVKILCKAFCAGFLCVFALWLSTKIINVFVTLAAPLLSYYLISIISYAFRIPPVFQIDNLSKGNVNINNDPSLSFLFTILIFTFASIIFGSWFVRSSNRRIENG